MIHIPETHIDQYIEQNGLSIIELDILQEECAELIKAIAKYKRYLTGRGTQVDPVDNIIEELTHVAISSEVVARILHIKPEDIIKEVNKKAIKFDCNKVKEVKEDD